MSTTYASRSRPGRPVQIGVSGFASRGPRSGFRPDIEGLRAVAVLLVVLDHASVPLISGGYIGVDVFFVISGFLITTLLLKEMAPGGTLSIAGFYARRAARLLPASTVVLLATLIGAWLWLPPIRFPSIAVDALTSTFYGLNYRLAIQGTDYLNATATPSPLQHFWSLAVEEQFYFVWPILLLTASWLWGGHRTINRLPIALALLALTAISLTASIRQTEASAPWAYFGAHTRAWELAVGALLALVADALARAPRPLAALMTWTGLAAVVTAALTFDETTAFPGYAAVLPVVGSALIIAGGCSAPRGGAGLLLNTPPAQLIGKLSYSWYLWHWPILMIAPSALGLEPTLALNLALAASALVVAAGSYAWVEEPIRSRKSLKIKPARGIGLGLSLSGAAAVVALVAGNLTAPLAGSGTAVDTRAQLAASEQPAVELAKLLAAEPAGVPSNLTPRLAVAKDDRPAVYADECHLSFAAIDPPGDCSYGDPTAGTTVFLVGDSHAAHWLPALDAIGKQQKWRIRSYTKSACPAPSVLVRNDTLKRPYTECGQWRDRTLELIRRTRPAMVVMASNGGNSGGLAEPPPGDVDQAWTDAWVASLRKVKSPKTKLVVISDTPWPAENVPECVSVHLSDPAACARDVESAILQPRRREMVTAAAKAEGATVIDPTPWFCNDRVCPTIVGNTLVYTDDSHMSATYSTLLAPVLLASLP